MPRVLVVDDEAGMRDFLALLLEGEGFEVATAADGGEALRLFDERPADLVISDIRMPKMDGVALLGDLRQRDPALPVVLVTAYASAESAIQAMKLGAVDYITKPFKVAEVKLVLQRVLAARPRAAQREAPPEPPSSPDEGMRGIVGRSPKMIELYKLISRVSDVDSTVLITGESGTGKSLVARTIHAHSARAARPFLAINCGAIPRELLESELFGHVRGAFTGAVAQKAGLFEVAKGGTLLLDEVTEMSLDLQVKILQVLQERILRRVGGTEDIGVDVRVIAATNKDPLQQVARGLFREDLFYRLNVISVHLPSLRDRQEDIRLIAVNLLGECRARAGRGALSIAPEAMRLLEEYPWPGNVRELENVIERAVALEPGETLTPASLPEEVRLGVDPRRAAVTMLPPEGLDMALEQLERKLLVLALERADWVQTRAAELLKITFRSFRHRAKKYGIAGKGASGPERREDESGGAS
jgi:two-component system response regulator PilR (NtrC family)